MDLAVDTYRLLVFHDRTWDYLTFKAEAEARASKVIGSLMDSIDANLRPFFSHGGKPIQYHGWADPGIAPESSVNYYKSAVNAGAGRGEVNDTYRLFMVPGMGHCAGGDRTSTFDMVSALNTWVTRSKAPAQIPASRGVSGAAVRTPFLCAYPQTAVYKG
jgi:feruloyl esterase